MDIKELLKEIVTRNASDIFIVAGSPCAIKVAGKIIKYNDTRLMPLDTEKMIKDIYQLANNRDFSNFLASGDDDFSFSLPNIGRFRVNAYRQRNSCAAVLRIVRFELPDPKKMHIPEIVCDLANQKKGMILVTGPAGSGKSTTLACIIDQINQKRNTHIITIEDPVEFIFSNKRSLVSQRQVLIDTPSFPDGIKYALRQDPDVIFIGEIRDKETVTAALKAAETGHLVFATIHTNDAIQTVNRIVNMFEPSDREFVRGQLASILRGTVSQKLVPIANASGRRPACEVLVVTPTVKDFIEKDKLEDIYELVKKGSFNNMITMNASLYRLFEQDLITEDIAMSYSDNKNELQQMFRGVFHGTFGYNDRS